MQRVGSVSFARLPRIALHGWNVCIRAKSTSSTDGYRAVAHISLGALTHNMDVLQRAAGMGHPLWPAVKANAYGHGAVHVARHLVSMGYSTMCVAYVAEALELLEAGVGAKKILVLAGMLGEEAKDILAWSGVVEPVISSPDTLQIVARLARDAGVSLGVHLMVDTGMSRQGCLPHQYGSLIKDAMALSPVIQIRGFMTHFACADDHDRAFTNLQIARFQEATASLPRGIARHAANSAAIFQFPEAHFDACRPGVSIYGMLPGPGVTNPLAAGLRPVLSLHARVTCVKTLPRGVGVSYSHSFVTKRDSTSIAVACGLFVFACPFLTMSNYCDYRFCHWDMGMEFHAVRQTKCT